MSNTESPIPGVQLPPQIIVEAEYESRALRNVESEVVDRLTDAMSDIDLHGKRVAVAAGSRGIDKIDVVVRSAVGFLKSRAAEVFIIPSMGSHGGATAQGQIDVLATLGITEASAGAAINAGMETELIGETPRGFEVHRSIALRDADAVLIINRIKPHTDFLSDRMGSGLRKMSVIGLGKTNGAFVVHRAAREHGYEPVLAEVSEFMLHSLPLVYGLGLIEDAHHQLAKVETMSGAAEIIEKEPALFRQARDWMPSLPFENIDLLIVDEIGKNISGAGMDPNIIGRNASGSFKVPGGGEIKAIYVRGLTPETHGNAIGVGLADVVSSRLVAQMDPQSTFINALSGLAPATVRTPMHFRTDAECLNAAFRLIGVQASNARIMQIQNTLALTKFAVSAEFEHEIAGRANLKIVQPPAQWSFGEDGNFAKD